jgi:hypothetical protein
MMEKYEVFGFNTNSWDQNSSTVHKYLIKIFHTNMFSGLRLSDLGRIFRHYGQSQQLITHEGATLLLNVIWRDAFFSSLWMFTK